MDTRHAIFQDILAILPRGRMLDLGTGHGEFAVLAHRLGWTVTAVDARTQRMPGHDGIEWVQADIRDYPVDGYDCISLLGLFYHLEVDDQIDLLRRCGGTPTILDTHVSVNADREERGYRGELFDEGDTTRPQSSWGNPTSFWPTEQALVEMLHDCGFTTVLKRTPAYRADRTFYLCLSAQDEQVRHSLATHYASVRGAAPDGDVEAQLRFAEERAARLQADYDRLRAHPVVRTARFPRDVWRKASRAVRHRVAP